MECEGEQVHGGEHHGEVLLAVAEVVLEVVAVGLEDVEAFVLDLPSGPSAGHDLGDGVAGDGQRGHESAAVRDLALGVTLLHGYAKLLISGASGKLFAAFWSSAR